MYGFFEQSILIKWLKVIYILIFIYHNQVEFNIFINCFFFYFFSDLSPFVAAYEDYNHEHKILQSKEHKDKM